MKAPKQIFYFSCLCCNKRSETVSLAAQQASEHICPDCKDLNEGEYITALSISRGISPKKKKSRK
jgi:hypothetical protein